MLKLIDALSYPFRMLFGMVLSAFNAELVESVVNDHLWIVRKIAEAALDEVGDQASAEAFATAAAAKIATLRREEVRILALYPYLLGFENRRLAWNIAVGQAVLRRRGELT